MQADAHGQQFPGAQAVAGAAVSVHHSHGIGALFFLPQVRSGVYSSSGHTGVLALARGSLRPEVYKG
jgi:hypothetical protein